MFRYFFVKLCRSLKLNVVPLDHISIFIYVFLNLKSFPIQELNWKFTDDSLLFSNVQSERHVCI